MLKNICKLEMTIEGKVHSYLCDNDAQLPHIKEALFQFLKYVGQIEDQIKAQQDQAKAEADQANSPVIDEVKAA